MTHVVHWRVWWATRIGSREKIGPEDQEKGGGKDRQGGDEEGPFFSAETAVLPQLTRYQDLVSPMVEEVQQPLLDTWFIF